MDIFSLKPKEIIDPTVGNKKGNTALSTLANLSSAFKEMINNSGGPGDSAGAFDALARQFAGAERVEPEARPDDNPYERGDLGQSNRDDHADASDDHSSNRGENRAEPADNYENKNNQSRGEERSDAADDNRSDTGADNASDRSAGRDEQPQDSGRENASDTGKEAAADGQAHADSGSQNQQQGPANSGDANNQAVTTATTVPGAFAERVCLPPRTSSVDRVCQATADLFCRAGMPERICMLLLSGYANHHGPRRRCREGMPATTGPNTRE